MATVPCTINNVKNVLSNAYKNQYLASDWRKRYLIIIFYVIQDVKLWYSSFSSKEPYVIKLFSMQCVQKKLYFIWH